jgi:hypothetical protein
MSDRYRLCTKRTEGDFDGLADAEHEEPQLGTVNSLIELEHRRARNRAHLSPTFLSRSTVTGPILPRSNSISTQASVQTSMQDTLARDGPRPILGDLDTVAEEAVHARDHDGHNGSPDSPTVCSIHVSISILYLNILLQYINYIN